MIANKRTGWIGIDIGTSTIKLVQLSRSRNRIRIAGSAIVPRCAAWPVTNTTDNQALSSADELQAATSLYSGFRGKRAAATLPMTICDVLSVERPPTRSAEQDRYIRQAIELATQTSAAHMQYDIWDAENDPKSKSPPKSNILTVARTWTDQLCEDVSKSGWWCQAVDGLPLALARSVAMVEPKNPTTPVAALDWGYGRATLCIVAEGRPMYVRCLKDCGLHQLIETLVTSLNITADEAQHVLQEYGIADNTTEESHIACELIEEIITPHLAHLEEEIRRTISHLNGLRRSIIPQKLYLFGGGATINGLANHLTSRVNLNTKPWDLGAENIGKSSQTDLPPCLLGPAIALSALAWESQ